MLLKKLLIAAAAFAAVPVGTAYAHGDHYGGYYGGRYGESRDYRDYRDRRDYKRYLYRKHRWEHRLGFRSAREHRAFHRQLERAYPGYHRDYGYNDYPRYDRYYRDRYYGW